MNTYETLNLNDRVSVLEQQIRRQRADLLWVSAAVLLLAISAAAQVALS